MGEGKEDNRETGCRRDLEADVKETGHRWRQLERLAQDRSAWQSHVGDLCPRGGEEGFD